MNNADHAKANKITLRNFGVLMSLMIASIAIITYFSVQWDRADVTPAPSYQEQNLKVLKAVKPNDLVICSIVNPRSIQPDTQFAFLVDRNDGNSITGYHVAQRSLFRAEGGKHIPTIAAWGCEMHIILEPFKERKIGSIILDGPNPPPK